MQHNGFASKGHYCWGQFKWFVTAKLVGLKTKAQAEALVGATAAQPSRLVGQRLDVFREGKWRAVKVLGYDDISGTHTLTDVHGAKEEQLRLVGAGGERWRRRDEPLPQPRFVWDGPTTSALFEACTTQLAIVDKEHEYAKHALPPTAAGRSAESLATHDAWSAADRRMEHPAFAALLARVVRGFPSAKWMKEAKVRDHFVTVQAQRNAAAKEAKEASKEASKEVAAREASAPGGELTTTAGSLPPTEPVSLVAPSEG